MLDSPRCPRCGTCADATVTVELHLTPAGRDAFRRHADVVRRELGLPTDDEAVAEAVLRLARQLNQT